MKRRAKRSKLRLRNKAGTKRSRKLFLSDVDPVRKRVAYLCDYLFAGNSFALAHALDQEYGIVRDVLRKNRTVSVRLFAQIIRQLNVRPEWLLHGTGPVFAADPPTDDSAAFQIPAVFSSSFSLFDTTAATHGLAPNMKTSNGSAADAEPQTLQTPHFSLAIAIHAARSRNAPVLVCLSDVAIHSGAGQPVCDMLRKKYATGVAFTGAAALADMARARQATRPDMNLLAKLAASQGLGYGEAIARWGFSSDARVERSVLRTAHGTAAPITTHAEVGELEDHLYASARGAELGAAVGAASYVDLLIFTEQVRRVLADGGVVLVAGSADRFFRLFAHAMRAAETTISEAGNFCIGVIDRFFPEEDFSIVEKHGGFGCLLRGSFNSHALNILQACDAVYSGNVPNEFKK